MTTAMSTVTSSGDVIGRLYKEFSNRALQDIGISNRERDVLQLMANGMADKEIAASLAVSKFTINKHVGAILRKIGAASRTEAAVRAIRLGLIA